MQDLDLTEEQRMIRDMARDFAKSELIPNAEQWEKEGWLDQQILKQMGELGFLGMMVPEEWSGSYIDYTCYALAVEEIARGCAATGAVMSIHNSVGCAPLLRWGTEEQKQQWLPSLATGEIISCFCLTERQAGSEANNLRTKAVQEGG